MAVFRIEKTRDYTIMANHHLKNRSLSLKAKGLLSVILSLPGFLCGKKVIYTAQLYVSGAAFQAAIPPS